MKSAKFQGYPCKYGGINNMELTIYLPAAAAETSAAAGSAMGLVIPFVVSLVIIGAVIYFPTVSKNKKKERERREIELAVERQRAFREQEEQWERERREQKQKEREKKEREKKEREEREREEREQKEREQREQIIAREAVWRDDYGELFRSRQRP
jgi:uncharacterized protein HemX